MRSPKHAIGVGLLLACAIIATAAVTLKGIPYPAREKQWSIGIYAGQSPFHLHPGPNAVNPVLSAADVTDVPATFVADPFMIKRDATWYMFFEVLNANTGQGDIGLATSSDGWKWRYGGVVLDEPFHLSYPHVFESGGVQYMVPESLQAQSIRLYRADEFPTRWTFVRPLLAGHDYSDPSLVHYGDKVELADTLVRLALDPVLRQSLGDRGRARVERMFTAPVMAAQYSAIYRELIPTTKVS